jgi:hypothetical protein
MSVALHGNLRDFGIGEVFQLIGQQRKTGVLQVRGAESRVDLHFDEGRIVSASPVGPEEDTALGEMLVRCGLIPRERLAEFERTRPGEPLAEHLAARGVLPCELIRDVEDLLTRETIFDLLRWAEGSFGFVSEPVHHDRPAELLLGAEQVLMDGLRMVDEWRAFVGRIPAETAIFRRTDSLEAYRAARERGDAPSSPAAESILLLVDGRSPVRRVIDLSRLGTFTGMRGLVELQQAGWIEPVAVDESRVADLRAAAGAGLRRWVAAVAPLVLLAGLALWPTLGPNGSPPEVGVPLGRSSLAEVRARLEVARARNLVEAYRLDRGDWPRDLAEVERWAGADALALTHSSPDAYYFARSERGPIVLAPER